MDDLDIPFFATTGGIVLIVLMVLYVLYMIGLLIWIILKTKKGRKRNRLLRKVKQKELNEMLDRQIAELEREYEKIKLDKKRDKLSKK